ncbi:MAG: hypothetical protein V2I33_21595 [Kangiellaceae bacterium]|jgi:hypothetical protein|nr:hypothetical protein [Kangiellaceae bacterium]
MAIYDDYRIESCADSMARVKSQERPLIENPEISFWVKRQVLETRERDPLDALNDARLLLDVLQERYQSLVAEAASELR